jgi:hypothetical protein
VTTGLLPAFESRCRTWYGSGHTRRPSEARWRVYVELAQRYGPLATTRHVGLLKDALDHAEMRAKRESEDGKCTS